MRILDLFCGAGGAAMGMHRACPGAEIVGVDWRDQPRYPFSFRIANALAYPLEGFDFIWASPPCQAYTSMRGLGKGAGDGAPDLVEAVRAGMNGTPWVMENVIGAPMRRDLILCGSMFGLPIRRHRSFESSFLLLGRPCTHDPRERLIAVYGDHPEKAPIHRRRDIGKGRHDGPREFTWRAATVDEARKAMGINWMNWRELTQAVPPAYSFFIMKQFLASWRKK